jgi:DNA invertase Pin-like site-specific DNA recombinase
MPAVDFSKLNAWRTRYAKEVYDLKRIKRRSPSEQSRLDHHLQRMQDINVTLKKLKLKAAQPKVQPKLQAMRNNQNIQRQFAAIEANVNSENASNRRRAALERKVAKAKAMSGAAKRRPQIVKPGKTNTPIKEAKEEDDVPVFGLWN